MKPCFTARKRSIRMAAHGPQEGSPSGEQIAQQHGDAHGADSLGSRSVQIPYAQADQCAHGAEQRPVQGLRPVRPTGHGSRQHAAGLGKSGDRPQSAAQAHEDSVQTGHGPGILIGRRQELRQQHQNAVQEQHPRQNGQGIKGPQENRRQHANAAEYGSGPGQPAVQ